VLQVWPDRSIGITSRLLEGSTAHADTQVLPFGVLSGSGGDIVRARTYLHFPLGVFPPGTQVLKATLFVHVDSSSRTGEAEFGAYRVLDPWGEVGWDADPDTWAEILSSPIAITLVQFDEMASGLPASTALVGVPVSSSKPAGHGLLLQDGTVVILDPANIAVGVAELAEVDIRIEDVANMDYADVILAFDPELLEVVDDEPGEDGVQIQPGDWMSPGSLEANWVDQDGGEISFAQVSDEPVSGSGVLATITFRAKASGVSALEFDDVILEDPDFEPISAIVEDGSVTVTEGEGAGPLTSPLPTPTLPSAATPAPGSSTTDVALGQVEGTWLEWDVTALFRAWLAGEVVDYGLALAPAPDPDADPETAGNLLLARLLSAEDPETMPYVIADIKIYPVTPTPTPAPILPAAGGRSGWGTAGLLLIGTALLVLGLAVRRRE
jgi:hypothetical protein